MKTIVIGERFNMPRRPHAETLLEKMLSVEPGSADRYWNLMCAYGAFHYESMRAKLRSVGVPPDAKKMNMLPPAPQGDPWEKRAAETVARDWLPRLLRDYKVVFFAGGNVRRAFNLGLPSTLLDEDLYGFPMQMCDRFGRFEPVVNKEGTQAVAIPHPSGLCRWWNEPVLVDMLRHDIEGLTQC